MPAFDPLIADLSTGTVATGDLVRIADIDDSNTEKSVTAQSIADLGSGGSGGYPPEHIAGLITSNAADADHDITFGIGTARDDGDNVNFDLTSALTKRIDATWAAGTGNGGLFSGSVAANTWYHTFVIEKDSDFSLGAGFDTSETAANIPTGYTNFRRVGAVLTDGSSNILAFTQLFDTFWWKFRVFDLNDTTPPNVLTALRVQVPPISCEWLGTGFVTASTSADRVMSLQAGFETGSFDNLIAFTNSTSSSDVKAINQPGSAWTNSSGEIKFKANATTNFTTFQIETHGYNDSRGRTVS